MKTCACLYGSVILLQQSSSSFLTSTQFQKQQQQQQQRRYRYLNLPSFPILPLTSFSTTTTTTTTVSVIQRDFEVQLDDTVSSQNENHATIELETQPHNEEEKDEEQSPPSVVVANQENKTTRLKKKKEQNDDSSFDNRFKLRNGKEVFEEKTYLVGVERKGDVRDSFGIEESLNELEQLADTAGLLVVGSTYQKLASPNPRTYIGSGKVSEIKSAINALEVETVIFDDELSAGQLRNLEKIFGGDVRVCDRTALILDIFNQRAATHEASLQAIIN